MILNLFAFVVKFGLLCLTLLYLGYPTRRLMNGGRKDPTGVETMLVGAALATGVGWYWSSWSGAGVRALLPWMLAVNLVPFVVCVILSGRLPSPALALDPSTVGRRVVLTCGIAISLIAAVLVVFSIHYQSVFREPESTPLSIGNNDVASYALSAQHLLDHGFDDPGPFVGHSIGTAVKRDITGAFLFLALTSTVSFTDVREIEMVALVFALYTCAAGVAGLIMRMACVPWAAALGISVVATASSTVYYSAYHVFTAQLLAMGTALVMIRVAIDIAVVGHRRSWNKSIPLVGLLAVLGVWLVLDYPHMTFLTMPVVVLFGIMWCLGNSISIRDATVSSLRVAALIVLGLLGTALLVPTRYVVALRIFDGIGTAVAGWPLGRLTFGQLLGLARFPNPPTGTAVPLTNSKSAFVAAGSIGLVVTACCVVVVISIFQRIPAGDRRARLLVHMGVLSLPIIMATFLYLHYGETYQGWKGAVYFQPLLPAAVLTLAWVGVKWLLPRAGGWTMVVLRMGIVGSWFIATLSSDAPWRKTEEKFLKVDRDLREVALLVTSSVPELNLNIGGSSPFWDNMWAGYFLNDKVLYPVAPSYIGQQPSGADWTLRLVIDPPGHDEIRVGTRGRFALDRRGNG